MSKPVFVIGDVHGHIDRLEALLTQEGIIGLPEREFTIELSPELGAEHDPVVGHGKLEIDRLREPVRINHDVEVVQLGDLGHWGDGGSPTGDKWCWEVAPDWLDIVLWGNHDRALVDKTHSFKGYQHPGEVKVLVDEMYRSGRLRMAHHAHGYLLVHAGIHLGFKRHFEGYKADLAAEKLNGLDQAKLAYLRDRQAQPHEAAEYLEARATRKQFGLLDAVGGARGGGASEGGVLWMDWTQEKHLRGDPFKYICGHTRGDDFRQDQWGNWCVDLGSKDNGCLGGLWLVEGEEPRTAKVKI